ncbi:MAG: hypothetical protein ABI537_16630 [Casimicrobiaceae bacterium]
MELMRIALQPNLPSFPDHLPGPPVEEPPTPGKPDDPDPNAPTPPIDEPDKPPGKP